MTKIEGNVFYGCSGFTGDLEIPDSVTSIEPRAFYGCSGFTGDLIIPESVTNVGAITFSGLYGLSRKIYFNTVNDASTYNLSPESFRITDKNSDTTIYGIPGTYIETYALENGYTFADGSDFFEERENKDEKLPIND